MMKVGPYVFLAYARLFEVKFFRRSVMKCGTVRLNEMLCGHLHFRAGRHYTREHYAKNSCGEICVLRYRLHIFNIVYYHTVTKVHSV
jgi:hypothetical protein